MTKPTKWPACQAKTQISLGIRPVWSESSHEETLGPQLPIERTVKTLIWLVGCPGWSVFAERKYHFIGFIMRWFIWAATWQNQQNECAPSKSVCPVWSESSLSAWRNLGSLATHWVHSEDSDQTERMPRLICVFTGRTLILLVLSCRGSFKK